MTVPSYAAPVFWGYASGQFATKSMASGSSTASFHELLLDGCTVLAVGGDVPGYLGEAGIAFGKLSGLFRDGFVDARILQRLRDIRGAHLRDAGGRRCRIAAYCVIGGSERPESDQAAECEHDERGSGHDDDDLGQGRLRRTVPGAVAASGRLRAFAGRAGAVRIVQFRRAVRAMRFRHAVGPVGIRRAVGPVRCRRLFVRFGRQDGPGGRIRRQRVSKDCASPAAALPPIAA
ncbi:MAG: hypothetical protein ACOX12_09230, partial [Eggerthellaceae bacterium]